MLDMACLLSASSAACDISLHRSAVDFPIILVVNERLCSVSVSWMNVPTAGQKRFVLVAATGMVGGYGLRHWPDATPPGELPRKKRNATALAMLGNK
jgi:hypothetical protein